MKQFLFDGVVNVPVESLLISSDNLKELTNSLNSNKTYCFKTDPGKFGWCGTCEVMIEFTIRKMTVI